MRNSDEFLNLKPLKTGREGEMPKTNTHCDGTCILSGFGPNTETVRNFYRQLNKQKMANC